MNSESKSKEISLIVVAVVAVVAGAVAFWYFRFRPAAPTPPVTENGAESARQASPVATPADLGTAIFEQTSNPVQDKLPEAVAPVQNPIQEIYKNPFQ